MKNAASVSSLGLLVAIVIAQLCVAAKAADKGKDAAKETAIIEVWLPKGATLRVNGKRVSMPPGHHQVTVPKLDPKLVYEYQLSVEYADNPDVNSQQVIAFSAGDRVKADFRPGKKTGPKLGAATAATNLSDSPTPPPPDRQVRKKPVIESHGEPVPAKQPAQPAIAESVPPKQSTRIEQPGRAAAAEKAAAAESAPTKQPQLEEVPAKTAEPVLLAPKNAPSAPQQPPAANDLPAATEPSNEAAPKQ